MRAKINPKGGRYNALPRVRRKKAEKNLGSKLLGSLIGVNPKLLKVLDRHGVSLCAGCYLTLFSPLKKSAAYHAVPDVKKFLRDVRLALRDG